ncbi:MAG: phosphoglycerate kinase [Methanobacteriota archaeon]|nr:MAG: phosphoglycerate kinase [Euryarchaeota archaeon]
MSKKTIEDIDLKGKRVLVRVDFNVPIQNGMVMDDTRIKGALPTIRYLMERDAKIILMSHLGRPKLPDKEKRYTLEPVAQHLSHLLNKEVQFSPEIVGSEVERKVESLKSGDILLLENTRYHPGEKKNDPEFAKELSKLGDVFVNDAFGTLHRAHASTVGITQFLPSVAGLLVKKELEALEGALNNPTKPVIAIFGGAKVSDKIEVVERFVGFADKILIGGGMAFTFLKLKGKEIGNSLYDKSMEDPSRRILESAEQKGTEIILPVDCKVALSLEKPLLVKGEAETRMIDQIGENEMGLDIGPETSKLFREIIMSANTIFWNGPMGVFENPLYEKGTIEIAKAIFERSVSTIVGGGDSVFALNKASEILKQEIPPSIHVSTGGGATIEYLSGKELPGLAALEDAAR